MDFWLISIFIFLNDGSYFDIAGLWSGPFLTDVKKYSDTKVGIELLSFSFGVIIGSFFYPFLVDIFHTKKWVCFVSVIIAAALLILISFL